jgi:hypothetical protein
MKTLTKLVLLTAIAIGLIGYLAVRVNENSKHRAKLQSATRSLLKSDLKRIDQEFESRRIKSEIEMYQRELAK